MLRFGTCPNPPNSFMLLLCILTRGGNRWQEKWGVWWSLSRGCQFLPPPPQMCLLPHWSRFIFVHISKKKKKECDFQIELQRKCKLIKKKEKVGRLVALAVTFWLSVIQVSLFGGKESNLEEKENRESKHLAILCFSKKFLDSDAKQFHLDCTSSKLWEL